MRAKPPVSLPLTLLVILFSLPWFASEAQAQAASPILLTARAGFDGYCKDDRWIPVRVTLENTGTNTQVQVQAFYANRMGGKTMYERDLRLPAGARKEFFFYLLPQTYSQKLTVSVLENKKTLTQHDLNFTCLKQGDLLVGLLAETPTNYLRLKDLKPLNGVARTVSLLPEDLPDQEQGWQALDALVVAEADSGALSAGQRAALELWLAEGGKLLVVGGANWQPAAAGLTEFLPLTPTSTQRVASLSALSSYFHAPTAPSGGTTLATGILHQDAQTLVEQDGLPLLTRRAVGFGEVYYLAANPSLQPLKDWDGLELLYSHLLGVKMTLPRWATQPWDTPSVDAALGALPGLSLPSVFLICLWLGLYLMFIGPLNYLILRRLKRLELAWLTIPALVIAFTLVAYLFGFLYRGTRPTLNRLLVAQGWDGAPHMRADAVMGVYSPNRTRYTLQAEAPFKFAAHDRAANLQTGNDWLAQELDTGQQMPDARVEIGGLKSVALQGSLPALAITHNLSVTISSQAPRLIGEITNSSDLTFQDAFLVTPGSIIDLQDLKPGETRSINNTLHVNRDRPGLYYMGSPAYQKFYPYYLNPGQDLGDRRRSALLQAATVPLDYSNVPSNWGIYLMGWVETPLLPVSVENIHAKTVDTSLVIHMLTPAFQFEGKSWQLNSAVFAWESSTPQATPYSASYDQVRQGYTLRFRPAVPLHYSKIASLTVKVNGTLTDFDNALQLWDYTQGAWVIIDVPYSYLNSFTLPIPEPERFVGPGGEVRLNLQTPDKNNWAEIYETSLNLVVEP